MISYETMTGTVEFSNEYLSKLIGHAVRSCYGVVAMVPSKKQKFWTLFKGSDFLDKGISVSGDIDNLIVDLHISVIYGINIDTIAASITEAVKYTVTTATKINVQKVNVRVDGIVTE